MEIDYNLPCLKTDIISLCTVIRDQLSVEILQTLDSNEKKTKIIDILNSIINGGNSLIIDISNYECNILNNIFYGEQYALLDILMYKNYNCNFYDIERNLYKKKTCCLQNFYFLNIVKSGLI